MADQSVIVPGVNMNQFGLLGAVGIALSTVKDKVQTARANVYTLRMAVEMGEAIPVETQARLLKEAEEALNEVSW